MNGNRRPAPDGMKWCWKGQHYVALNEFPPCDGEWDGLRRMCRPCSKVYRRELYLRNKAKAAK